jgi:hypothetical protein
MEALCELKLQKFTWMVYVPPGVMDADSWEPSLLTCAETILERKWRRELSAKGEKQILRRSCRLTES